MVMRRRITSYTKLSRINYFITYVRASVIGRYTYFVYEQNITVYVFVDTNLLYVWHRDLHITQYNQYTFYG